MTALNDLITSLDAQWFFLDRFQMCVCHQISHTVATTFFIVGAVNVCFHFVSNVIIFYFNLIVIWYLRVTSIFNITRHCHQKQLHTHVHTSTPERIFVFLFVVKPIILLFHLDSPDTNNDFFSYRISGHFWYVCGVVTNEMDIAGHRKKARERDLNRAYIMEQCSQCVYTHGVIKALTRYVRVNFRPETSAETN